MKIPKLKDQYIEDVTEKFQKDLFNVQKELSKDINKIIGSYFGKDLTFAKKAQLINEIEQRLNKLLLKTDYKSAVKEYLVSFDKINAFQKTLQSEVNGISLSKIPLSEMKNAQISIVRNQLLDTGISAEFSQPIKEILTRNILVGTNISEAKDILDKFILGDDDKLGVLERYSGQTANDTLRQYDGLVNKTIKDEYDMSKIAYVNSNIKTTRGQCLHWTSFDFLTDEQLLDEIPIANSGGTLGGYKCSGMISGTNLQSFEMFRGGFNCRHEAVPIF
jgi:hypothetical protein